MKSNLSLTSDGTIRYCPVEVRDVWRSGLSGCDCNVGKGGGDGGVPSFEALKSII